MIENCSKESSFEKKDRLFEKKNTFFLFLLKRYFTFVAIK